MRSNHQVVAHPRREVLAASPGEPRRPALDASPGEPRRWLALAVLLLAAAIDLIDTTIVNIALPSIQRDLSASSAALEWTIAGYTLAFGLLLITGGRLGDAWGRRRTFLTGVAGFTAASAASGLAPSAEALVAARIAQGGFAALMVPQVLSMIQALFPAKERAKAYGMYGAFAGLATISGPLLAGVLLHIDPFGTGWRSIFLINLPLGLATIVAAVRLVPESRAQQAARFDLPGVALATAALALLLYPLVEGRELGWPAWTFACMAASAPVFALFAAHERRRERRGGSPLVPLGLLAHRGFAGGALAALVFFSGVASFFLVLTVTLQRGLGFSPLHTGLTYVPWSLGIVAASGAAVQLAPRLGRRLTAFGSLLMAAGIAGVLVAVDRGGADLGSLALAPGLLVAGLGMGMVAPTLVDIALVGVRGHDAGSASGVLNTALQLGGALGVAAVGAVFFGAVEPARAAVGYTSALHDSLWLEIGVYVASAALMLLLPKGRRDGRLSPR